MNLQPVLKRSEYDGAINSAMRLRRYNVALALRDERFNANICREIRASVVTRYRCVKPSGYTFIGYRFGRVIMHAVSGHVMLRTEVQITAIPSE